MKHNSKNSISLFSFFIFILLCLSSFQNVIAINIWVGPGTYINGSDTQTIPLPCGIITKLPPGGTLTFVVSAGGNSTDYLDLCIVSLPAGATFTCVSGIQHVQSTFAWTQLGYFSGYIEFVLVGIGISCYLTFDWPLPVELSSFTSLIHGNSVTLNWQTSSEDNNARFEIEKTKLSNGNILDWIRAGSVPGNGTTTSPFNYSFTDRGLNSGVYKYRLKQIDYNGNFEYHNLSNDVQIVVPVRFELIQNYPNPFNPSTVISYNLATANTVSLKVYNSSGIEVSTLVEEFKDAGYHSVILDGKGLASGIYYYKLVSENFVSVKKMILLK